jgi:hypothetical protein
MSAFDDENIDISRVASGGTAAAEKFLTANYWPPGLQKFLFRYVITKNPIRFFICDDSGSVRRLI